MRPVPSAKYIPIAGCSASDAWTVSVTKFQAPWKATG